MRTRAAEAADRSAASAEAEPAASPPPRAPPPTPEGVSSQVPLARPAAIGRVAPAATRAGVGNMAAAAATEPVSVGPGNSAQAAVGNAALAAAPPAGGERSAPEGAAEPVAGGAAPTAREGGGAGPAAAAGAPAAGAPAEAAEPAQAAPAPVAGGGGAVGILEASPPSLAADAVRAARAAAAEEVSQDRQQLVADPPTLEAPSGLAPGEGETAVAEAPAAAAGPGAARIEEQEGEGSDQAPLDTDVEPIIAPLPADAEGLSAIDRAPEDEASRAVAEAAQRFIDNLATRDDEVVIDAGMAPRLELGGEADPGQWDRQAEENQGRIDPQFAEARREMSVDEGVDDIYPRLDDELLVGEFATTEAAAGESALGATPAVSAEVRAGFDSAAAGEWAATTAEARAEHDVALADREQQELDAHRDTERQIAEAEVDAANQQRGHRAEAGSAVAGARQRWQGELARNRARYGREGTAARARMVREVGSARTEGERKAANELRRGETRAHERRRRAEREAAAKRREAKAKQNESSGFFGWLKSKLKSFLKAIRKAINAIFDALRAAVKRLIEAAKRLAAAAIELARRAAIAAIRVAGKALEVAADVFLAGFPEARDRAKAAIRRGVQTAEEAVNRAARWLRDRVNELLDALGAALDAILAAYQAVFNAIIDVVEFITVKFLEILEGIERLVRGARAMPDYFEGQVQEELLGMDLTQPMPFERTGAPELAAAEDAIAALPQSDRRLLGAGELSDAIAVDQVADFQPDAEFFQGLRLPPGGEIEFGENSDPANTLAALQAELAGSAEGLPAGEDLAGAMEEGGEDLSALSTEERLQRLIDAEPEGSCTSEKPEGEQGGGFPEHLKFGPLTKSQRARYLLSQMGKGIRHWFSCNWPWLLAATVAALVGIIALEIVTGGAITAALPIIMSIVAAVMIGVAIARAASYFGDYLSKSWSGDIAGGGLALARALAIGAVELIFAVLTYITAGAFRVLSGAVKATGRVAGAAARATGRGARGLARGVRAGGRAVVRAGARVGQVVMRGGRIVMRGLPRGFARGVKSLDDLARRLSQKLRFRKFKLRRRGRLLQLLGYINPWLVLANGELEWVDEVAENVSRPGQRHKIGDEVVGRTPEGGTVRGKLVGGPRERPDYRSISEVWHGKAISDVSVIHHKIEQQVLKRFKDAFTRAEINAATLLAPIRKGPFNSVVHLSRIRRMWNKAYQALEAIDDLSPAAARRALLRYQRYVDEYIEAMKDFAENNKALKRAIDDGNVEEIRRLLQKQSDELLEGGRLDPATRIQEMVEEARRAME